MIRVVRLISIMILVLQQPAFAVSAQWDDSDSPLTGPAIPYRRGDFRERAVDAIAAMFAKYPDISFRKLRLVERPQWGSAPRGLYGEFEVEGVSHLFCAGFYDGGTPHFTTALLVFEPRYSREIVLKACRWP